MLSVSSLAEAAAEPGATLFLQLCSIPGQHLGCSRTWVAHFPHHQHIHGGSRAVPGVVALLGQILLSEIEQLLSPCW